LFNHSFVGLVDGNTDDLAIRFIIDAKLLKSQNQLGSRGMGGDESEIQRGKCTLGYTCIDDETDATKKYLQVLYLSIVYERIEYVLVEFLIEDLMGFYRM
jgi:hypothetical protein